MYHFDLNNEQSLKTSNDIKLKYGEINTPYSFIQQMLSIIPNKYFKDPTLKWLDPGAGYGYFSIVLFNKLFEGLRGVINNDLERKEYIIQKMIYMIDIQEKNILKLREHFGPDANIFNYDFLSWNPDLSFDFVIGNPPYNSDGLKKVPTNKTQSKKDDGNTIWTSFVKHSINLLKPKGFLCMIIPSIWMKPDKAKMYYYLTQYQIYKLHSFSNTQTNRIFSGQAQTPTCYFLLQKTPSNHIITLYDSDRDKYIPFSLQSKYFNNEIPLPAFGSNIVNKMRPFVERTGCIVVYRTNMPTKGSLFSNKHSEITPYKNIKTCLLDDINPRLVVNYSNKAQPFYKKRKIILAHKMYGFPYLDLEGEYGISNRDNFIIINKSNTNFRRLQTFLSTKTVLYIFEATRYRMKYLQQYAFYFLPDITKLSDFPDTITDETIAKYFNFDDIDRENIQKLHKKKYNFIPEVDIN